MNILISVTDLCVGGGQNFAVRLAKSLSYEHSVILFNYETFEKRGESLALEQLPPNLEVKSLPASIYWLIKAIDAVLRNLKIRPRIWQSAQNFYLKSIISQGKVEVVNSHLYDSDRFVTTTLADTKIPIVISDHGDYRYILEKGLSGLDDIEKVLGRADAIAYPSQSNAQAISKYSHNFKSLEEVIYYGIPVEVPKIYPESARQTLDIPKDAFVFGMVARGIPNKGWTEAIAAFQQAKVSTQREIHLVLVGGGDYLSSLEQSLDSQWSPYIHFAGYSSDPNYWIESFDVGLLPTYFPGESLPNSVIEYLASGKPVIATKVGGIPEMLSYGGQNAGFLVRLDADGKADITQLTEAILSYVNDSNVCEKHSALARQAFEKFDMQTCIRAYEELFRQVLNQYCN
jgi:L-malate glycosyltransferase